MYKVPAIKVKCLTISFGVPFYLGCSVITYFFIRCEDHKISTVSNREDW